MGDSIFLDTPMSSNWVFRRRAPVLFDFLIFDLKLTDRLTVLLDFDRLFTFDPSTGQALYP